MTSTSGDSLDLVVVGGGPAGMMAGLLFARAGCRVKVLEKHADFFRDFRGDTVHPSTMEILGELGLLDRFLKREHDEVRQLSGKVAGKRVTIADFTHLPVPAPFVALMPQWDFLDFLAGEARHYPTFDLEMQAEAVGLLFDGDRVAGVRLKNGKEVKGKLVIAADGRASVLRDKAALPKRDLGAPIDVLWFKLPKLSSHGNATGGTIGAGTILVRLDRGDYWQCAFVVAKGTADELRSRGLANFRKVVAAADPEIADVVETLTDWDQVKLLSVTLDRLIRWSKPGLLAIGDAAHAMSPVGGVGINLAIQDAVAAANVLAAPLARGDNVDGLLDKVRQDRILPTRLIQGIQKGIHDRLLKPLLARKTALRKVPLVLRMLDRFPLLRRIPARLVGLGIRREHVRSPDAGLRRTA